MTAQPDITLANPVSHHFPTFIVGNATKREELVRNALEQKGAPLDELDAMVDRGASSVELQDWIDAQGVDDFLVHAGSNVGQHVIICGAGPTLRENIDGRSADQLWGCNSALTWLYDNGYQPTHGFAVDQTVHMCAEWESKPPVEYLIATTVHPFLADMLVDSGQRVRYFHNYVGIRERPVAYDGRMMPYENWLYARLFPPPTLIAGSGLNAVTRAIDVALYMGFSKITVLGADCSLRVSKPRPADAVMGTDAYMRWLTEDVVMHADGGNALRSEATAFTLEGEIDGRLWTTKPDMMISAVFLVKMARQYPDRIELVGDTLPNALIDKDDAFLARLPALVDSKGKPI